MACSCSQRSRSSVPGMPVIILDLAHGSILDAVAATAAGAQLPPDRLADKDALV